MLCFPSKRAPLGNKKKWLPGSPPVLCSLIYLRHVLFKQILSQFLEGPSSPPALHGRIWHQLKNLVASRLSIPSGICYSALQSGDLFAPLVSNNRPNFLSRLLLKTASLSLPGTIARATLQKKKGTHPWLRKVGALGQKRSQVWTSDQTDLWANPRRLRSWVALSWLINLSEALPLNYK